MGRFRKTLLLAVAIALSTPGSPAGVEAASDDRDKVRGITISTHTWGVEWGWDVIVPTLRDIRTLGANWVSIHPYATVRSDGRVEFRDWDPDAPPQHVVRPIREAQRLGMKILIKPHLAYWGSRFAWRGDITFERDAEWQRFFADYERWIVKLAHATRQADAFVVGTELDRTLHRGADWRRIIRQVRQQSAVPLTYAANWSDYQRVSFWDDLDVVGIQAYFPLTAERSPTRVELEAGWQKRMGELRDYSIRVGRPIVFTELGYNRSFSAPTKPWDDRVDGRAAEVIQEQCLREALRAIEREPSVIGAFLWKWFPEPFPVGRDFQLATPRIRRAISDNWRTDES